MKKLIFVMIIAAVSLFQNIGNAQINVNINAQPLWGPVGYDHVDYYYLPDIESYYYVPKRQFVYQNNGKWLFSNSLPTRYSGYNLYNGYKVVINGNRPYSNFNNHKVKYAKYKNWGGRQMVIKNSKDKKYYVVKGHPHGTPPGKAKKAYSGNGNGKGNGNAKGKH